MRGFGIALSCLLVSASVSEASTLRLLLESDPETGIGDVFLSSFDTFDDLVNSPAGGGPGGFSGLKISPGFSVGGLAYEFDPPAVPLPASAYLLLGALGLAGALRRRA